jgi:hypothetical protein
MSTQDFIALAVVAAAVLWYGWRVWRGLKKRTGCGCDRCPVEKHAGHPGP